jgi:hypothetical protein
MAKKVSASKGESAAPRDQKDSPKVLFDDWFTMRLDSKSSLRPWMRKEVSSFFQSLGLSERENLEAFDEAYSRF